MKVSPPPVLPLVVENRGDKPVTVYSTAASGDRTTLAHVAPGEKVRLPTDTAQG